MSNNSQACIHVYGIKNVSLLIMNIEPPDDSNSIGVESINKKAVFDYSKVLNRRICLKICRYYVDYEY